MKIGRLLVSLVILSVIGLPVNPSRAIEKDDMVAVWLFDDPDAGAVEDMSGNGHDGVIMGSPGWTEGKFGTGLDLPGTGTDYVEVPDHDALRLTDAISLLGWVKKDIAGQGLDIVGKDDGTNRDYNIHVPGSNNSGKIYLSGTTAIGSTVITDGEWHHVAGTWNGSEIKLYIDGVEEGSAAFAGPVSTSDVPVKIGFRGTGSPLQAVVDEIAIFNRALTKGEINDIINTGLGVILAVQPSGKLVTAWASVKGCF